MDTKVIHIVLGKANPLRMNGVNKVVHELATHQAMAGWNVEVWGITKTLHSDDSPERSYKLRLFQAYRNLFKVDKLLIEALKNEDKETTVLHLHGGFIPTFYTLSKKITLLQIPYIFTPHGSYNEIALRRSLHLKKLYIKLFEKHLATRARRVHCLGKSEVKGTKKLFKKAATHLIPYGFKSTKEDYIPKAETNKFIVGFCGRIDAYTKGLDALTEGFLKFAQQTPEAELWIIGDGQDLTSLKKDIMPYSSGKIIFHGSKYGKDKFDLLNQLDVFAHPSRNEGLPTAVLEAAAMGIPTLITEATNLGDFVNEYKCGFVMQQTKGDELCDGLNYLKKKIEQESSAMKLQAKLMVEQSFDWFELLNGYADMYQAKTHATAA